ncbi:MAG: hypothetical protein JWP80_2095, partial [Pseudomonas sp.]|nr:hypothetical protein [Pseudomonas sp.]
MNNNTETLLDWRKGEVAPLRVAVLLLPSFSNLGLAAV